MQNENKNFPIVIPIIGNPNVGKSTLFNSLTGLRQHVGNWPGKTVEKKEGIYLKNPQIRFIDLPGAYSIHGASAEEKITYNYLQNHKQDTVLQIIDATNLRRGLYLTLQLLEMGIKVVMALNLNEQAKEQGIIIDDSIISSELKIPVVVIDPVKKTGIDKIVETVSCRHTENKKPIIDLSYCEDMKATDVRVISGRHNFIDSIVKRSVTKNQVTKDFTKMIDRVLLNKILGLPIFLFVMWLAFVISFEAARPFVDALDFAFAAISEIVKNFLLTDLNAPAFIVSAIVDAGIGGVSSVLIFLPNIFILFLTMAFLETTGYLARAAFIMDRLMKKIGLQGKSFIPLILGFGCNVPAIMASRTIDNPKERLLTIMMTPFMSCSARLPVYILFAGIFFSENEGTIIFSLYLIGIIIAIIFAFLMKKIVAKKEDAVFLMELPPYRIPGFSNLVIPAYHKSKMFVKKAGTIILSLVLIIWFLANLPIGVDYAAQESVLGFIGTLFAPLLEPIGFGDWRIAVSLMFGFVAKEIIVGSLGTLYSTGGKTLTSIITADFTALSAYSFMVFTLLYSPCMATATIIKKETQDWKIPLIVIGYNIAVAWIASFIVYQTGLFLGL
ncbi:MAG: ferrous iron transport protein B [Candidatus Diapherotrites archaeon CG11_big_fil_rev_8_21_14_0_20_37_9]|nr:MAG: ferrous iron transport protein B [Candidatus Diapherotrites archaeon CG11_big_fil_rev_8_21_14_0_20_37_9]